MGKEWYRFPSNFFLPSNNWNVKFIKSEFKGQLPQPFLTEKAHATAIERPNFNNLNLEELDRYVKVNGILLPKLFLPTVRKNCSKGVFFSESAIRFSDLQISEKNIPKNYIDGVLLHCCLCLVVHTYLLKVQMGLQKREVSIFKINFLDEKCIIS